MSPHRARMTDKTLTSIVFLKCNARGGITNSALQKNKWGGANWLYVWCNWVNFHTLPNAYKIKQINNKANHLLEFEYTLLGSTSTCTRTCTWNSVLVLVLVNFASTCTCTCTRRVSEYLYLYLPPKYLYLYLHTVYLWHVCHTYPCSLLILTFRHHHYNQIVSAESGCHQLVIKYPKYVKSL